MLTLECLALLSSCGNGWPHSRSLVPGPVLPAARPTARLLPARRPRPPGHRSPRAASWSGPLPSPPPFLAGHPTGRLARISRRAGRSARATPRGAGCGACAQGHTVASGPSRPPAQVHFGGVGPTASFHSVLFRAFSPRYPCSRLGNVRETLPSVVTPEPFGLNSKGGRRRPLGCREGALHAGALGAWGTARAARSRRLRRVDMGGYVGREDRPPCLSRGAESLTPWLCATPGAAWAGWHAAAILCGEMATA